MSFDVDSALKAGYSRSEIADYLASQRKFDVGSARKAGYSDDEILSHLLESGRAKEEDKPTKAPAPAPAPAPAVEPPPSSEPIDYSAAATSMQGESAAPAPTEGLIARVGKALRPEYRSVMEDYQPTPQQDQANRDQRLSYGAGPIRSETAATADLVRSGMAQSNDPTVNRVAATMQERGEPGVADLLSRAANPENQRAARLAKAEEFRTPGEWAIDTLSAVSQGTTSLVQLPVNIIAPGSELGQYLRDVQKEWQAQESEVLQAQRQNLRERIQSEDGFFDKYAATVTELVTNPALGLSEAIKQVPMFLGVLGGAKAGAALAGGAVNVASKASPTLALGEAISGGAIRAGAQAAGTTAGGVAASAVMAGGDAAGSVYERLTDPKQTSLEVWKQNPDYQRLTAEGKSSDEAIKEIATAKARLAAVITAPLGVFGFMGAEASIATRGLARGAAQMASPRGAVKTFGKEVLGEQVEEGGTQFGGNVITRTVDPSQNLTEGVPEAMGTALVTSSPFAALGAVNELRGPAQAPVNPYVDQAARTLLSPDSYDPRMVSPELTVDPSKIRDQVAQAATVDDAVAAAENAAGTINVNIPDPLTVPAMPAALPAATAALPAVDPAVEQQFGFDKLRLQPAGASAAAPAPMNAPRPQRIQGTPVEQLTDEQLEQIAGDETIPAITRRGASVELTARRSGANLEAGRVEPTINLQSLATSPGAELSADGQQRVEPTFTLPDVGSQPAVPGVPANGAAAQPGFAVVPDQPGVRNVPAAPVGGPAGAQRAREAAQRSLDTYAARTGNPVPAQLSASPPELDAAVNEIAQAIGSQFAGRVYAYHDPRPDALNGLAIGKAAFVNTANVEINAARTSLHEFKHTVEQIAKAETAQGLTGTAAQKFVAEIDSIYDDMTEEGKRAYLEKFLAKDELVGIKDPAAREARIQQLLAAPETRSEMTADFLGNRATDKQFWKDVAEADPEGFKGFVEKWLRIIDNLLAQLRGTKTQSRKESARVDKYVRDLNQAKMVAREALIAYSRATRQPAPGRPKMDVPAAVAQAPQAKASGVRLYEGKSGFVVDEEALQRRNLAGVKAPNPELLGQEQADMFAAAAKKEAEASFDKAGKFIGKYKYRVAIQRGRGGVYMFNDLEAAKQFADTYGQRKGAATAPQLSARQPVDSAKAENRMAIVVGAKPGEFNWNFTRSDLQPPPFSAPTQYGPRLEVIGEKVYEILRSGGFKKLAEDAFGIKGLRVAPLHGSWLNKPEPSFALYAEDLTFEQADELSKLLGFAFAQDATVVFQPTSEESPGEIPAIYIGGSKKLTDAQMKAVLSSAQAEGIDYSSTADGKAVRFLHFGDEAGLAELMEKAARIAGSAGLGAPKVVYVRSQLNEAESYTKGSGGSSGQAAWLGSGEAGRPDLFRRTVDHVLVPYAKTVGAEGYRFAVSRFGQRFGLDADQQELIRQALLPKGGATKSTVGIASGKVKLDIKPTGARGTVSVSDILWALQNQSAQAGLIEPGDYSDQARKLIAEAIADEVIYNITDTSSGKSAIGWYDRALKAAKEKYATVFPEIKTDRDRELMFDAVLGITSQGNDVFNNSLYAGRVYELVTRQNMTLGEAVAALKGSFGGETNAIENNILKLEDLLNRNGYDAMRAFFNKKDLVANINARLRSDTTLFYKNKPLEVEGAATQKVTGWMVFGPKIGSFINNLHGDYSTLTADLWFSRTWNRILGFSFVHSPALEADQYQKFVSAVLDEYRFVRDREGPIQPKKISDTGRATMPEFGKDTEELTDSDVGQIVADPDEALRYAAELEKLYRKGSYKVKSDLRRAAKNWIENREKPVALPRTDLERDFQQRTVETAQRIIKRRYGQDITIADIQAALWYYEKDNLFKLLGGTNKKSEAADYAGAADEMLKAYQAGDLFYAKTDDRYVWGNKGDYLNQRPAASARQRDIEDVPREQLAGRRISLPVLIEDTGQTATITLDAKDALDDVEEREGAMQRLLECLRK